MEKGTRFLISYHSNDGRWKDVFYRHCKPYLQIDGPGFIEHQTSDKDIDLNKFYDGFGLSFDVVFLIISKDYLSLVGNDNLETSILNFERKGAKVVLVHAEHCEWQKYEWIKKRGLWPNNSNALSDDWGYPEKLNRHVSELIRDVIPVERDSNSSKSSTEPPVHETSETPDEKEDKFGVRAKGVFI